MTMIEHIVKFLESQGCCGVVARTGQWQEGTVKYTCPNGSTGALDVSSSGVIYETVNNEHVGTHDSLRSLKAAWLKGAIE